jgi:TAG lipase / steryl ester hydrolase / phospholipase A2 / LPA acyltransferase
MPTLQRYSYELFETIFLPAAIVKQLVFLMALETSVMTIHQVVAAIQHYVIGRLDSTTRQIRQLQSLQKLSANQNEWMELAEHIDKLTRHDIWRLTPECPLHYEHVRISARIDEFVHLMRRNDLFELMFVLRGGIGRHKFGLLQPGLFSHALAGTKVLVESYHSCVCDALNYVCDAPDNVANGGYYESNNNNEPIPTEARLAFFNETRHAYGRTALLLSGGAALGFYHIGVAKALIENNLMPRVIGGSSAGSIVCAMIGTRTDAECILDLFQIRGTEAPGHSGQIRLDFFRPPNDKKFAKQLRPTANGYHHQQVNNSSHVLVSTKPRPQTILGMFVEVARNTAGAFTDMKRAFVGFMPIPIRHLSSFIYDVVTGNRRPQDVFKSDTEHFRDVVRANVGDFTFQEAFDRTGRILNIVVTPNNTSDPPRLLNYLTAPHVMVWSAAVASSSLPGVFEANRLVVKEADGWERYESSGGSGSGDAKLTNRFSDGSMEQDLPMQQLSEMFNVNHFIVSQANPHAVLFASYSHRSTALTNPVMGVVYSILKFLKDQVRSWLGHLVECVSAGRFASRYEGIIGTQFFTQEYEGRATDISLIPWLSHRSLMSALLHIIYNPSEEEFGEWIKAAERETWSYIPRIKSHIAEEVTLDRCVQRLRRRLVEESWQKKLSAATGTDKMGERVPSFFTSPSLVNLGGLGIADQPTFTNILPPRSLSTPNRVSVSVDNVPSGYAIPRSGSIDSSHTPPTAMPPVPMIVAENISGSSGWGGMGLRGNRSFGNLHRVTSDASGLFIDEEPAPSTDAAGVQADPNSGQPEAQQSMQSSSLRGTRQRSDSVSSLSKKVSDPAFSDYVKTSSMAKFYYRRTREYSDEGDALLQQPNPPIRKTTSEMFPPPSTSSSGNTIATDNASSTDEAVSSVTPKIVNHKHTRRKSKSFTTLPDSIRASKAEEDLSHVRWAPLKE